MLITKSQNVPQNRKYAISLQTLDQQETIQINVELPQVFSVEDSIKFSLEILNQQYGLKLKYKEDLYSLYIAKKNGQIKQDLPCLDPEQVLYDTGSQLFVIFSKLSLIALQSLDSGKNSQVKSSFQERDTVQISLDESSIKSRSSYQNGLMDDALQKQRKQKREKDDGFCFTCI